MALFPSLPERAFLGDVYKRFPKTLRPLLEYHDILLRGPSPLSIAEREMIAAYVRGTPLQRSPEGAHLISIGGGPSGCSGDKAAGIAPLWRRKSESV